MLLHYMFDDKFADYAIEQFSNKKIESKFILVINTTTIKYVKNIDKVLLLSPEEVESLTTTDLYADVTGVIFHGLFTPWQEKLLKKIPNSIKVAWMFWGAEIYGVEKIRKTFLAPFTLLIYNLRKIYQRIKLKKTNKYCVPFEVFDRIDYCLTDVDFEYNYAKCVLNNKMQMIWYNYYSIEETVGKLINSVVSGNNVFLGNSSTIENNYIDALIKLKKVLNPEQFITIPVSYGDKWVRNLVVRIGNAIFKERFKPLIKFMPLNEYNIRLLDCGIMVMNHYRPNAQGNIITGLWLGMRVFLSKKSMVYQYFKRLNLIIFSVEDDLNKDNLKLGKLTEEEILHNRTILNQLYSNNAINIAVNEIIHNLS